MAIQGSVDGVNAHFSGNEYFYPTGQKFKAGALKNSMPYVLQLKSKGKDVNVVTEMAWKLYGNGNLDEVPSIYAIEQQLDYGQWVAQLENIIALKKAVIDGGNLDIYQQLYYGTPTGFKYHFPWLNTNENIRSIKNTWGKAASDPFGGVAGSISNMFIGDKGTNAIKQIGGALLKSTSPDYGMEEINEFKSTGPQSITLTFPLYNTLDPKIAFRHYTFVALFTFQNLKTRTSFLTFLPPKLYTLSSDAYNGIYMPVAYVSDFKVDSIGTTRKMKDFASNGNQPILIPEAYKISITFTELLPQSSNIFAGTMGGEKVEVITDSTKLGKNQNGQPATNPLKSQVGTPFTTPPPSDNQTIVPLPDSVSIQRPTLNPLTFTPNREGQVINPAK